MAGKRERRFRLWHIAVSIPVVCGFGTWAITSGLECKAQGETERELLALREKGFPTTARELERRVPPGDNAAPIYEQAFAEMKRAGANEPSIVESPGTVSRMARYEDDVYREWVGKHARTLQFVRDAIRKPDCSFAHDWSSGLATDFKEFQRMHTLARLCAARARYACERGDFEEAMNWMSAGCSIGNRATSTTYYGRYSEARRERIMLDELQDEIRMFGPNKAFLEAARRLLMAMPPLTDVNEATKGEIVMLCVTFDNLRTGKQTWEKDYNYGYSFETKVVTYPWITASLEACLLREFRVLIEARTAAKTPVEKVRAVQKLDKEFEANRPIPIRLSPFSSNQYQYEDLDVLKQDLARRLTLCALHIWEVRAKTGEFPASLDVHNPENIDPCSGKPFIYRVDKGLIVLYSVGADGIDGGGQRWTPGRSGPADDVALRQPRK